MSAHGTWARYFYPIVKDIWERNRDKSPRELKRVFRQSYPLKPKKIYQYRVWRKVVRHVMSEDSREYPLLDKSNKVKIWKRPEEK